MTMLPLETQPDISTVNPSLLLDTILRRDFYSFVRRTFGELLPGDTFVPNWHIDAICHAVMDLIGGKDQRLLVTVPPRSLKSIIISIALPAFLLGNDPTRRIVCVSYSDELSSKMSLDFRRVVSSSWYRRLFPKMIARKNTEREFTTTQGGGRFSTSVGGTLTGRGGNLFIVDDPIKPADAFSKVKREATNEWMRSTLVSRPDDKRVGKMILLMQRIHADDPAGIALASGQWKHLNLPAIAPRDEDIPLSGGKTYRRLRGTALDETREPLSVLEETRAQMGDVAFAAQYLQAPEQPEGGFFRRSWFKYAKEFPFDHFDSTIIQSWDTAMVTSDTADWSVCTTWLINDDNFYLMEVHRRRYTYPLLKRKIIELKEFYKPEYVIVERNGAGLSLYHDLHFDGINIEPYLAKEDKEVRAGRAAVPINTGRVFLPTKFDSSMTMFMEEVLAFPVGKHDDQVDSMVQAIDWWEERRKAPRAQFGYTR